MQEPSVVFCSDHGMEMGGLGSRRASEIGEQLTLEPTTDAPPQRRRKKKKTATIGKDGEHTFPCKCCFSAFSIVIGI